MFVTILLVTLRARFRFTPQIISGCQWGNILVWEEGLIDVELMSKNRIPCHSAPIIMFLYSESTKELISVSMDGTIKIWYYQVVREANSSEVDKVVEIDPSFTISVQDAAGMAKIMGMCKINNDPDSNDYFVQVSRITAVIGHGTLG